VDVDVDGLRLGGGAMEEDDDNDYDNDNDNDKNDGWIQDDGIPARTPVGRPLTGTRRDREKVSVRGAPFSSLS
jgi:hypothetical protein